MANSETHLVLSRSKKHLCVVGQEKGMQSALQPSLVLVDGSCPDQHCTPIAIGFLLEMNVVKVSCSFSLPRSYVLLSMLFVLWLVLKWLT